MDLTHGVVYCFVCGDNVYDMEMEKIVVEQGVKAWKTLGELQVVCIKRKRAIVESRVAGVLNRI